MSESEGGGGGGQLLFSCFSLSELRAASIRAEAIPARRLFHTAVCFGCAFHSSFWRGRLHFNGWLAEEGERC